MSNHFDITWSKSLYDFNTSNNMMYQKKEFFEWSDSTGKIYRCKFNYYNKCMSNGINNLVPYNNRSGESIVIFLDHNELENFKKANPDNKMNMLERKLKLEDIYDTRKK